MRLSIRAWPLPAGEVEPPCPTQTTAQGIPSKPPRWPNTARLINSQQPRHGMDDYRRQPDDTAFRPTHHDRQAVLGTQRPGKRDQPDGTDRPHR